MCKLGLSHIEPFSTSRNSFSTKTQVGNSFQLLTTSKNSSEHFFTNRSRGVRETSCVSHSAARRVLGGRDQCQQHNLCFSTVEDIHFFVEPWRTQKLVETVFLEAVSSRKVFATWVLVGNEVWLVENGLINVNYGDNPSLHILVPYIG